MSILDTYRADADPLEELRAMTNMLDEAGLAYEQLARFIEPVINDMRAELGVAPVNDVAERLSPQP